MIPLGLTATQTRDLHATLLTHHSIRVRVYTLTLSGEQVSDLTPYLLDGQINVDSTADVTRSASISLVDPRRSLSFDSDSPADSALFLDRMIRVWYDVLVGNDWIEIPVFTGPISGVGRTGDTVTVDAQGKESLAMSAVWRPITLPRGMRITDAIWTLMRERAGEASFSFPDIGTRISQKGGISLARDAAAWPTAKWLAGTLGRQLFYDGYGRLRLRSTPWTTVFGFTDQAVVSRLQISYDSSSTINTVWAHSSNNKISQAVFAPSSHSLSPWRLGRNGVPRYLLSVIEDDNLRSNSHAREVAQSALDRGLMQGVTATFDSLPIPHVEPLDVVQASTDEGSVTFHLNQFSLPLGTGAAMSVGYLRHVSPHARRVHR